MMRNQHFNVWMFLRGLHNGNFTYIFLWLRPVLGVWGGLLLIHSIRSILLYANVAYVLVAF